MATSRDVARLAGVSQATVSRTLSSPEVVSPETRESVYRAMKALNYVPHRVAQTLKRGKTGTIGVVVADLLNPAMSYMLHEITRVLDGAGLRATIWHGGMSERGVVRGIRERSVDGVIFTTATENSEQLHTAVAIGMPVVLVNRTVDALECDRVTSNNTDGAAAVADYLVRYGRTAAAFVCGKHAASTARLRKESFLLRMAELGHPVPRHRRLLGEFSYERALEVTREALRSSDPPDAIFCANDLMAFGALDAVRESGRDCWVIGYDSLPMSAWASFNLTTVRQPFPEMISQGIDFLIDRIQDPDIPYRSVEFEPTLVVRGSTDRQPVK